NQGTISVDTTGGTLRVGGNGSNTFTNQGSIAVSAGTLELYGSTTLAGLGTIHRSGGTVSLGATLDLAGGTLNLDAASGSWSLLGGTIQNGPITEHNGALLVGTSSGGVLRGVTVNGDLDLSRQYYSSLSIFDGLTLNGTLYLGDAAGSTG